MRVIATVVAVLVGVAAAAPASAEVTIDQIEHARGAVLSDDFQPDLPGYGSGEAAGSGSTTPRDPRMGTREPRDSARRIDTREHPSESEDGGALGGLLNILMWGLLAVGLGLMAFWFISEFAKSDADVALPPDEAEAAVAAATAAIIDRPLGDADELAARGEYAEAIHTLLLRTLHELARSAMVRVERAHTSREILARVPLLGDARDALSVLITTVEVTHFGDDPAGPEDYARCREQFNRFATAFRAGLAIQQKMPQVGGTALAS